jgi:hypothetical protein
MSASSNYLERKILDHVLKNTAFTQPTNLYVALFTNTSTNALTNLESGTLSDEVSASGTAYQRQSVAFGAASTASDSYQTTTSSTSATITFPVATATYGTVSHIAIMDASTGGNVLFYGALANSKEILTGDQFTISTGNLTVALA